jgi:NADH-quinone oxidoreductase subunit F
MEFLKAHNLRGEALARGRVGVIGGGNTAIDAARVALRQPGVTGVTLLYRRDRSEMPAHHEEIEAALEEGIELVTLVAPVAVLGRAERLEAVRLIKNRLGEPDASGRRRPIPIAGSEYDHALDSLIVAISEQPDAGALAGLRTSQWGTLEVNPESSSAGRPGVFGGGDVIRGPSSVIEAIADGKRAALMIDRYLAGKQLRLLDKVRLPMVYVEPIGDAEEGELGVERAAERMLPVGERRESFAEVALGLDEATALREARRCLRCDLDFTRPSA